MTYFDPNLVAAFGYDNVMSGFLIGLVVGVVLSNILFSVVSSAVNTIIVCFLEVPGDFELNHPQLSVEMRENWRKSWPEER